MAVLRKKEISSETKKNSAKRKAFFVKGRVWVTDPDYCVTLEEYADDPEVKAPILKCITGTPVVEEKVVETVKADYTFKVLKCETTLGAEVELELKKSNNYNVGDKIALDTIRMRVEKFPGEDDHYYAEGDVVK